MYFECFNIKSIYYRKLMKGKKIVFNIRRRGLLDFLELDNLKN